MNKFLRFFPILILLGFSSNIFGQSPNDACANAINLTLGGACTTGSILSTNSNTGEDLNPGCWQTNNVDGVWYKFTATTTDAVVDAVCGTLVNTPMIGVYSGGAAPGTCPLSTAPSIGCIGAYASTSTELALSGLTVGNVYYILVEGYNNADGTFCINTFTAPTSTNAGTSCPGVAQPVSLVTCADIGTSLIESSGGVVTFSQAGGSTPSPAPTCGSGFTGGSWARYDLAAGVTALTFNWESTLGGSAANGSHSVWAQVYQGTSCAALTTFSCMQAAVAVPPSISPQNVVIQNLNPNQDVWIYMYDDANKAFSLPFDVVGSTTPSNDACGTSVSSTTGCNLGAIGDNMGGSGVLGGPSNEGATCSGGTWSSNENTVWYTFSATTTTANISINNIICNNGGSGLAQFAAFTNCTCANNNAYGLSACFLGCAAATGTINLGSLTPGQTIYLAVDGNAGDVCKMGFQTTLVSLPVTWLNFEAFKGDNEVKLFWSTATEYNSSHFEIERSNDAVVFSTIGTVKANGNSNSRKDYSFTDSRPDQRQAYYRLKQYDVDGTFAYSEMIYVDLDLEGKTPDIFFDESDKLITIKSYSKGFDNFDVEVLDTYGKPAMETQKTDFQTENTYSIPVHSLSNGVYIINLKSNEGFKSYTKKIVIY